MKKSIKRLCAWMLVFAMAFTFMSVQASAADADVPSSVLITRYSAKDRNAFTGATFNKQFFTSVTGKITKLKSSNTSIVKTSTIVNTSYDGITTTAIYLTAKKAGTATVSFKLNGKTYKTKVTVKKYTNPVSSISIGSTKVSSSKFDSKSTTTLNYSTYAGKKVKIKVSLKSDWSIADDWSSNNMYYFQSGWMKSEILKNGKKVTITGGSGFFIMIPVINNSTGQQENLFIYFI